MNEEERQAELLEQFLNALAQDSQAAAPPELDAETAAFARMMAANPPVEPGVADRLWLRALSGAIKPHNHKALPINESEWETQTMTTLPLEHPQKRPLLPYTLVAAITTLVLLGAILLAAQTMGTRPNIPAALLQAETETPTTVPTLTPTPVAGGAEFVQPQAMTSLEDVLQQYPATALELDTDYNGELNAQAPYVAFIYVAPEAMTLVTLVDTQGFAAMAAFSVRSAPVNTPFGSGGGGGGGGGPVQSPQLTELQAGDTMNVIFSSQNSAQINSGGSYHIRFERLQPTSIDPNSAVNDTIDAAHPYRAYSFEVSAGDMFSVRVDDANLDSKLDLRSIQRQFSASDDDGGLGFNPELFNLMTAIDDTILVLVSPALNGQTGEFTLSVDREQAPDFTPGPVRLTSKVPERVLRLEGAPGTTQSLRLRPEQSGYGLSVQISDGHTALDRAQSENAREMLVDVNFPESGVVFLSIAESSQRYSGENYVLDVQLSLIDSGS